MIRVSPGTAAAAREALYLYSIRLQAVGKYRDWIFDGGDQQPPIELLALGDAAALAAYRRRVLDEHPEERNLLADGSIRLESNGSIRFATHFGASDAAAAYELATGISRSRQEPRNEKFEVYVDGRRQGAPGPLFHNSTGDWDTLVRQVEKVFPLVFGHYEIREREGGPVLADWIRETPPEPPKPEPQKTTYVAHRNCSPGVSFTSTATGDALMDEAVAALTSALKTPVTGDFVRVSKICDGKEAVPPRAIGGVHGYGVRVNGRATQHFFLKPEEKPDPDLARLAGAKDGDTITYSPVATGRWCTFTFHEKTPQATYRANVNYCLASQKEFTASATDEADVITKAKTAIGPHWHSDRICIMAVSENAKVFGRGFWTRAN